MEKNTKILLGIVAIGLAYLLYKKGLLAKKNSNVTNDPSKKDCVVTYSNCSKNPRKETIQIPIEENCYSSKYQPPSPPCLGIF